MYSSLFCSGIHSDNVVIRKCTTANMKLSAICVLILVPLCVVCTFRFTGNIVQVVNAVVLGEH